MATQQDRFMTLFFRAGHNTNIILRLSFDHILIQIINRPTQNKNIFVYLLICIIVEKLKLNI